MPYQSLNHILAEVTAPDSFYPVEIEVFLAEKSFVDFFNSIGTFTFIADGDGLVVEQIQTLLHSAMMLEISNTVPDTEVDPKLVPELCRKFKYRSRYFDGDEWSEWDESTPDYVVLGGVSFEEFENDFNTISATSPVFLHLPDNLLTPGAAPGWVYVLSHEAGELSFEFQFFNLDGTEASTVTGTKVTSRDFTVVRIPISFPADDKSPFFLLSVTVDGITIVRQLVADFENRGQRYDFCYWSTRGGWAFLPCHGAMTEALEVVQQSSESAVPANYFENPDISQFKIWDSRGRKKITVATGYWPQRYLLLIAQDFLLSGHRFIWNDTLQKWIPVLIATKSVVYRQDMGRNLLSMDVEFSMAFENNLPSVI